YTTLFRSEIGINAGIAGYFGVPVVCVTGDQAAAEEARALLGPELVTVPVKRGIGRVAADSLHPQEARRRIAAGVRQALEKEAKPAPLVFKPVELEVRFHTTAMADMANLIPESQRVDGTTVRFRHDDYIVAFKVFRAMVTLAYSAAGAEGAARPPRRRDGREVNGPAMNEKGHRGGRRGAWSVVVRGERATRALAALLGGIVGPGAVLLLEGDLGAGKTTFVKGLAEGMGIDPDNVSSPTFTLIHEYEGDVPL